MRISVALLICLLLAGCKKYPDGGHPGGLKDLSVRIRGQYSILTFTVDGFDSLPQMKTDPDFCTAYQFELAFDEILGKTVNSECATFGNNYWGITDDKTQLKIACHFNSGSAGLYPIEFNSYSVILWDILRFKNNELWLKTNLNGKEYELKCEKNNK